MKHFRRVVALMLAAMMVTTLCLSVSSCKKKGSSKKTVPETDPWYNATRVELDPGFSEEDYLYVYPDGPWMCHDNYVMRYSVNTRPHDGSASYPYDLMGIFDQEGKLIQMINLTEVMTSVADYSMPYDVLMLAEGKEGIRFYFEALVSEKEWDTSNGSPMQMQTFVTHTKVFSCEFDGNTGDMIEPAKPLDIQPKGVNNYWLYNMSVIEGYEICNVFATEENRNLLIVCKDGKTLYNVDFDKAFGPGVFKLIMNTYGGGKGTAIIEGKGKTPLIAQLDLATGQVTKVTDGKPLSSNQKFSSTKDGAGYLTKATGIYEYDVKDTNEVCKLNYDHCDVNRYEAQRATVLSVEENKVVLGCAAISETYYQMPEPAVVYVLEKTEKNPNAGKTILTVASLGDSVTYFEAEAMKIFNEQNPDYHVQLVLYDQRNYLTAGDATEDMDESDRQQYNALSMVSGSLAMDIRSGNGPDVVLGAAQSIDVLDSQYLIDLSPYLEGKTYNASANYSNIIEASKLDGKMYFIPTAFTISGIVTDGTKTAPDQIGFTYEQYESFVEKQRNGGDPVTEFISRMHFLNLCFQEKYGQWVSGKKMDLNTEDFREMAVFFKDKIPEGVSAAPQDQFDTMDTLMDEEKIMDVVFLENIDNLRALAHVNYFGENLKILGLPSKEGSGPSANITNSFSITAGTAVEEGAYAFLDILLSENVQKFSIDAFPINRAAAAYRVDCEREQNQNSYDWFQAPGQITSATIYRSCSTYVPKTKLDEILLQTFETVNTVLLTDNAVMMIIDEELPAYLLGQKDLDSVIETINNRAQNVFRER